MKIVCVIFVTVLCACAVNARSVAEDYFPAIVSEDQGEIQILTMSANMVDGMYYSRKAVITGAGIRTQSGIRFTTQKYGEAEGVAVRNTLGEVLVAAVHPNSQATLITILGQQFLLIHLTGGKTIEYVVPGDYSQQVADAMEESNYIPILDNLDKGSKYAREKALTELLARPEIQMVKEAAVALGKSGVTGMENPAAQVFYALAMRLTQFHDNNADRAFGARYKRSCGWFTGRQLCSNNGACCEKCPLSEPDNECRGMCGPGCEPCWDWLCGDCCYHQGCYDHDACCGDDSLSFGCLIPVGFDCNSYTCPGV